jgi:hypothetical protein
MQNLPKLYEIRNRMKPILDPGATMHQQAGTGIWCCSMPRNAQKQQHKKAARNKRNRNWQNSRHNDVEAVDQLFGETRWRSSRRCWKLSGFSGKLIKHSMKFASTSMILPRTCEPQGPLIPRKSAKEN